MTRTFRSWLIIALLLLATSSTYSTAHAQELYDVVIKNGMILDGTGNPFFVADVAIRGEMIVEIGAIDAARARRVIDATGMYVTPGFIDMHSHSANRDGAIGHPEGRKAANSVTQGITTETVTPSWPIGEKIAQWRRDGHALNEVASVNFNNIREMAMGRANREPTADELERMKALMRQGFQEGARYLFVNLENGLPDRFASTDELVELAKEVKALGGYYDTHQRSEGITPIWYNPSGQDYNLASHSPVVDGIDAVRETVEISERSGAKVVGHHVKVKGPNFWGASRSYVQLMDQGRARGAQVYFSIYGYTSYGNSPSVRVTPNWAKTDPGVDSRLMRWVDNPLANARENFQRTLDDPELKHKLEIDIEHQFTKAGGPERLLLVEYPADPQYAGKTLREIADMRNESPMDALIWLQLNGDIRRSGGGGFRAIDTDDIDVDHFIQQDYVAYVTDGGNIVPDVGYPHPRYYGIFPRFIRRYALDRPVITLPHAIRGMTSLAAQIIGLEDRGLLKTGYYADINVFDPITISDRATYMNPHQYSTGFLYVLINGTFVVDDGERTDALPGKVLTGPMTIEN
ncbi:MAG: amidohydrolase family protein [Gemmatimonadetes bacterium]|nr:amidohydrolase family protein [Gemmatimonadota bacterium]